MIKFLAINGVKARKPGIVAIIDGRWCTKWNPGIGWTCNCPSELDNCGHPDLVGELLDDRVLGDLEDDDDSIHRRDHERNGQADRRDHATSAR